MKNIEKYSLPENESGDRLHSLVKAGVGSIPWVGSAASEIFSALLVPPLTKRRNEWMEEVATGLQILEKNQQVILENLNDDEAFTTLLLQASDAAMRNHQAEKIEKLRNAVLNSATDIDIKEDLQMLFVRFINELSISHLVLLGFMHNNEQAIKDAREYEEIYSEFNKLNASKEIGREEFQLLCNDLNSKLLIKISPTVNGFDDIDGAAIVTTGGGDGVKPTVKVTDIGKQFLTFISEPALES